VSPLVQQFNRKVAFQAKEVVVENEGVRNVVQMQNRTLISPRLNEHLGTMEQAIVEQI
jgi:hypothetical protein